MGANKQFTNGKELNTLIAFSVANATKTNNKSKAKSTDESNSENE